jgi:hypothetical protein
MLDIAFKNLWVRKTRSILTILDVAVCLMLYLFMAGHPNMKLLPTGKNSAGR